MKHISVMIKPASSLCNMRCRYCFYSDVSSRRETKSFGIMQDDTVELLIGNIFEALSDNDAVTFLFQGGEPTLAGISFFENFCHAVRKRKRKITAHYALQTNGLLLDDAWCALLKENGFLVGLSLDCNAAIHNACRVDDKGAGTFQRVLRAKEKLDANQIDTNILCVLTNELARHPDKLWKFLCEHRISHVQLIPCMGSLGENSEDPYALTPKRFAACYGRLFTLWRNHLQKGCYISIKLFDDILNLLVDEAVSACGMTGQCQPQYVIEADGSVFPCDFYVLDSYYMGNIREKPFQELCRTNGCRTFLCEKKTLGAICSTCRYRRFCNGGCKRLRNNMFLSAKGDYCGYQVFLDETWDEFVRLAYSLNMHRSR